jgi:hypothetical protein
MRNAQSSGFRACRAMAALLAVSMVNQVALSNSTAAHGLIENLAAPRQCFCSAVLSAGNRIANPRVCHLLDGCRKVAHLARIQLVDLQQPLEPGVSTGRCCRRACGLWHALICHVTQSATSSAIASFSDSAACTRVLYLDGLGRQDADVIDGVLLLCVHEPHGFAPPHDAVLHSEVHHHTLQQEFETPIIGQAVAPPFLSYPPLLCS